MITPSKQQTTMIISVTAIALICIIWWVNGAELDNAWLYVFAIAIVALPAIETVLRKKNKE